MGMWSRALANVRAEGWSPTDDRWYQPIGALAGSISGERVTDDTALKLSTAWACGKVLWEGVASLPLPVYQRQRNGGKDTARDHPHYRLLHDKLNDQQTSMEGRETWMRFLPFVGNSVSVITWAGGARGIEATAIEPLDMSRVTIDIVEGRTGKRLRYRYREEGSSQYEDLDPQAVLHLKGVGRGPWVGESVISYAANTLGLAQAYERSSGRWMRRGANPSLVLTHPKQISKTAQDNLRDSVESLYSGADNAGRVLILDEDMKASAVTITPADMQFLESRKFSVTDICRFFRVPPHMVMDLERSTNNNIEHQGLEFVVHTLRPWLVRIEQRLNDVLFRGDPEHFAEFNVDGLLRGDATSRSNYFAKAIAFGWMAPNEVRRLENLNPLPGGDDLRPTQGNMGPGQAPGVDQRTRGEPPAGRAAAIVAGVAERCLKREREGLRRAAMRHPDSSEGFAAAAGEFYAGHAGHLVEALRIGRAAAEAFCAGRVAAIGEHGLRVAETWTAGEYVALFENNEAEEAAPCTNG